MTGTMRVSGLGWMAMTAAVSFGCTETDEPGPTTQIIAATYNAGLAVGFVDGANERAPITSQAIADLSADVVCVQEYFRQGHIDILEEATAGSFPNTIFTTPDPGMPTGEPACAMEDVTDIVTCTQENCTDVCVDKLAGCVLTNCTPEFTALPDGCSECVQANVGGDLQTIIDACTTSGTLFTAGGAFGTGLLTSYPIAEQEHRVFESTTVRRGAIYARLETEAGDVHAFCTHLNAVFDDIPYTGSNESWDAEQKQQIADLLTMIDEKAGADGLVLLMGDMNNGPAGEGYAGDNAGNYQLFLDAGFANPYTARGDEPCTYCETNPLVGGTDDTKSVVIDHVLLKGFGDATATAERFLDGEITVDICEEEVTSAYSDHYGVSVDITGRF